MKRRRRRPPFAQPSRARRERLVGARVTEREFEHLNAIAAEQRCSASTILRTGLQRQIRTYLRRRQLAKRRGDLPAAAPA